MLPNGIDRLAATAVVRPGSTGGIFTGCSIGPLGARLYFDDETCRLESIANPFGPAMSPMSSV